MLRLAAALLILLASPATAHAAFGEVEPLNLHKGEDCVRATGVPGQIALSDDEVVRLYEVARDGFTPQEQVAFASGGLSCPTTVVRPNGAAVIAGRDPGKVIVRVRDPGGAWLEPVTFTPEDAYVSGAAAAVSDRGDVLVTWREDDASGQQRLRATRRSPAGGFGPVETLGTSSRQSALVPALTSTGEALVLITQTGRPARVAIAAPGAPFAAPVTIGTTAVAVTPSLAVAADGRALVALVDERAVLVAERPPGGAFGTPVALADVSGQRLLDLQATLGPGGEAAVTWQRSFPGEMVTATRTAPGPFGAPRATGRTPVPREIDPLLVFLVNQIFGDVFDGSEPPEPAPPLTPDGRVLFTWWAPATGAPSLIAAPLAGGGTTQTAGGRSVAAAEDVFPLVLADGTPGLGWTTDGRLRFATDGVTTPAGPPLPRVTVGAPRTRVLGPDATLHLPVRCSGPCEVSATAGIAILPPSDELSLPRGGRGVLAIKGAGGMLAAPRWRVPVTLVHGAPGGLDARARTVRVRLQRPPDAPDTRIRAVRAERRGGAIRVTWSTIGKAGENSSFMVTATKARDRGEEPIVLRERKARAGQRTFTATLRAGREARWVAVRSDESFVTGRPAFTRVRR